MEQNKLNNKIYDYWTKEGGWNWQEFGSSLPAIISLKIASITLSTNEVDEDCIGWRGTTSEEFSVKSAHAVKAGWDMLQGWKGWSCIWKLQLQERAEVFVWTMAHDMVLPNAARCRRGLSITVDCGTCVNKVDDLQHLVRVCFKSSEIWYQLVPPHLCFKLFSLPLNG